MSTRGKRRQFGSVRRLRSGRWQARVPDPGTGSTVSLGTYTRKADADARIALAQADQMRGGWVDPRRGQVTLASYSRAWLREHPSLRIRTRETYTSLIELHIVPSLGDYELGNVTTAVIRSWRATLLRGTSPGQAPKAYRLLHTIFNVAVEDHLVAHNPCTVKNGGKENSSERPTASVPQVWDLADAMRPEFRALVLVAGFVGLRLGELQGLRRRDVDLVEGWITVQEQIHEIKGGFHRGPPKTAAGVRDVALPAFLRPELQEHFRTFAEPGPDGLLFPGPNGGPFRRMTVRRNLYSVKLDVGLDDRFVLHDLRHTAHTLTAQSGATTKEAMAQMGQSTPGAALHYQHATQERAREVADRVHTFVAQAAPDRLANVVPLRKAKDGA